MNTTAMQRVPTTLFYVRKHVPNTKRPLKQAMRLFNDGKRLYALGPDGSLVWLKFVNYWREAPCAIIPGADFSGQDVRFRTFGHTIGGSVVVSFRERNNNWAVTISIGVNNLIQIGDSYLSVVVTRLT